MDLESSTMFQSNELKILMLVNTPVYDLVRKKEINQHLLPRGVRDVEKWLKARAMSTSRKGYEYLSKLTRISPANWHYASVSDSFWVKTSEDQTWDKVNLYQGFPDSIGRALLTLRSDLEMCSPEWTTTGVYTKKWQDPKTLVKYDGAEKEFLSYEVAKQLGFKHQEVRLEKGVAYCANFTSPEYSLVHFKYSGLSISDAVEMFADTQDMFLHDYLVYNRDRHDENWGFLMCNKTGEYISLAPLYDHNLCCYSDEEEEELMSQQFPTMSVFEVAVKFNRKLPKLEIDDAGVMKRYKKLQTKEF